MQANVFAQVGFQLPEAQINTVPFSRDIAKGMSFGSKYIPLDKSSSFYPVSSIKVDPNTGLVVIEEKIQGKSYLKPLVFDKETFHKNSLMLYYRTSMKKMLKITGKAGQGQEGGGGLTIKVPIPIAKNTLRRLFGSADVGLTVQGNVNIRGSLQHQEQSQVKTVYQGSDYTFKLEQTQRFNIEGKVGDKVSVAVDQDSERPFEFENNLRLIYSGDEDEIIKNISAGNIGLSLPGTQFISFSGSHQGLFGLKSDFQVAGINFTAIASLEKGQKQSLKLTGGAQAQSKIIADFQYLQGIYFFLDYDYKNGFQFSPDGLLYAPDAQRQIIEIELWKGGNGYNQRENSIQAWAVADPANPDTLEGGNQNNIRKYFVRLEENRDYYKDPRFGYIILEQPLYNEVLAVSFKTVSGTQYGDLIPPTDDIMILKLLRTERPLPSDDTWGLEWRNVYSIGGRNIDKDNIEISIVNKKTNNRDKVQSDGKNYLEIFGLDRTQESGALGSDDKADVGNVNIFNLGRGNIMMPGHRPFAPHNHPFDPSKPSDLNSEDSVPEIYDTLFVNQNDWERVSKFDFEIQTSSSSQSFNLGFNILEGSEEVFLDGARLVKGVDYEIDYSFGQLTILNQSALNPGADLEVKYESGEVFQLEKKTLFGTRAEYRFNDNNFLGATALYLNEKVLEQRVRVGNEPLQNFVWGFNAKFGFSSQKVTNILNKLPFLTTNKPTVLNVEGEFAQVRPNPNSFKSESTGDPNGVAFLDDFEGSKRASFLGVIRKQWTLSSVPDSMTDASRGRLVWYNPWNRIYIKDILPTKDVNTQTQQRVDVLTMELYPRQTENPDSLWGGVMKALSPSNYNQSENKFIEIWVKGNKGTVNIDLGLLSEDAMQDKDGAWGTMNTEDFKNGIQNGILDDGEDIGLDGIAGRDGTASGEPFNDDWAYSYKSDDYSAINGTEANGTGDKIDGSRIPDTEDINKNGGLDLRNDYFKFKIRLGEFLPDGSPNPDIENYIKGGQDNAQGWRLYRIPLNDYYGAVGNPQLTTIEYARIWISGINSNNIIENNVHENIKIYNIEITGNEWKELGIAETDTLVTQNKFTLKDSSISIEVINTEDNAGIYIPPPGVEGITDRITQVKLREQSLNIKFKEIPTRNSAAVRKTFYNELDLIHYKFLKMYVYGVDQYDFFIKEDTTDIELFFRIGRDDNNYYEFREPLYKGWDARNEIIIPLPELTAVKLPTYGNYRDLGEGKSYKVVGDPSLRMIKQVIVGIKNKSDYVFEGEVWIDEMRVSEVEKEKGKAYRASVSLQLADLGSFSGSIVKQEADFHNLNEKFGTGNNSVSNSFSGNFDPMRLFSQKPIISIPVTVAYSKSKNTPKYFSGSDILMTEEAADSLIEKEISEKEDFRFNTSIKKSAASNNWLLKNTLDKIAVNFAHSRSSFHDFNTKISEGWSYSGGFGYNVSFPQWGFSPFKFLNKIPVINRLGEIRISPVPRGFNFSGSAAETGSKSQLRGGTLKETHNFTASRSFETGISPINGITLDLKRGYTNDLREYDGTEILQGILDDSTELSMTQSFSAKYSPRLFSFITNSFSYSSDFATSKNIQLAAAGRTADWNTTLSGQFAFDFRNLLSKIYKPPLKKKDTKRAGPRRPRPRRPGDKKEEKKEEKTEEKKEEKKGKRNFRILDGVNFIIGRIDPVSFTISESNSNSAVGLEEKPGLEYMLGFTKDPGVEMVETVGNQLASSMNRQSMNFGTSLKIHRNIPISLSYSRDNNTTESGITSTGTSSKTGFGTSDSTVMPLPDWSIKVRGLEKLPLLNVLALSVSADHAFKGKQSSQWQGEKDNKMSDGIEKNYSPLIHLAFSWKGNVKSDFSLTTSEKTSKSVRVNSATRTETSRMSFSTSFTKSTGFRIPLPFWPFKNRKFKNNIQFSMLYQKSNSIQYQKKAETEGYVKWDGNEDWSIKPSMSYSFTSKVAGSTWFSYGETDNLRTGKRATKDFGIEVNITIRGN